MPRITRTADVTWEGNVARGNGSISAGSGAFTGLPYSLPTRIGAAEGKTSPEELLAAAHAGCFAMGLASELTGAEAPPERLEVTCTIVMDEVEGQGHQIVGSEIEAMANAPGLDAPAFDGLVEAADAGCPFSTLLKNAGATVSVSATLRPS
ncbi:MAG TPA: OsmC family peroxiredoxin [Gaiellaceae bacterium]|nr:OsmC family peroxiredoxin [Gaiellaceae bacterium]